MTTEVISGNLVEVPASTPLQSYQAEYVVGSAVIGMNSMLDASDVAITASSETSGFEAVNVSSRLTYSGWRPSATGAQYLYFTGSTGHAADYLTIAGHNLFSKGATIDLAYSDDGGATYTSLLNGYVPTSDSPFMLLFTQQQRLLYRLTVNVSGTNYPTIAVVLLGARLALQRGIYVGHRPAPFSRAVNYLTEVSEGGQILGRAVLRRATTTDITLRNITPAWSRAYLAPFLILAETLPFSFMWNTDDRYKGEVIYGFMENQPQLVNEQKSFMACDLSMRGLA